LEPFDGDCQCSQLVQLSDIPDPFLAVDAVECALVAVFAQGYYGVVLVLVDVMGVTGSRLVADRARQVFNGCDVPGFPGADGFGVLGSHWKPSRKLSTHLYRPSASR
jgi:hypothetical protein